MATFTVNGKSYKTKEIDFNGMCDLEDMGVSVTNMREKSLSLVRAYVAFCANISPEEAGKEIAAHMKNGGKLDSAMELAFDALKNSDFFQSVEKTAEAENAENQTAESK